MHLLYAIRSYNYNPNASTNVYLQVKFTRSAVDYVLRYTLPNSVVSIFDIFEILTNSEATPGDHDVNLTFRDPNNTSTIITPTTGYFVDLNIDAITYEQIHFIEGTDNVTQIHISVSSVSPQSAYLFTHIGTSKTLPTIGVNTITALSNTGNYFYTAYNGTCRLPLNVATGIIRNSVEMLSQVSSEYEILTNKIEGGTDITPNGVYNSYTYSVRGKKIKLINFPFSKFYYIDNFLEFISEDTCTVYISSALGVMLFGVGTSYVVKIDCSESGSATVTEYQENLNSLDIAIYNSTSFRS